MEGGSGAEPGPHGGPGVALHLARATTTSEDA
jgi:hypothetical protein